MPRDLGEDVFHIVFSIFGKGDLEEQRLLACSYEVFAFRSDTSKVIVPLDLGAQYQGRYTSFSA